MGNSIGDVMYTAAVIDAYNRKKKLEDEDREWEKQKRLREEEESRLRFMDYQDRKADEAERRARQEIEWGWQKEDRDLAKKEREEKKAAERATAFIRPFAPSLGYNEATGERTIVGGTPTSPGMAAIGAFIPGGVGQGAALGLPTAIGFKMEGVKTDRDIDRDMELKRQERFLKSKIDAGLMRFPGNRRVERTGPGSGRSVSGWSADFAKPKQAKSVMDLDAEEDTIYQELRGNGKTERQALEQINLLRMAKFRQAFASAERTNTTPPVSPPDPKTSAEIKAKAIASIPGRLRKTIDLTGNNGAGLGGEEAPLLPSGPAPGQGPGQAPAQAISATIQNPTQTSPAPSHAPAHPPAQTVTIIKPPPPEPRLGLQDFGAHEILNGPTPVVGSPPWARTMPNMEPVAQELFPKDFIPAPEKTLGDYEVSASKVLGRPLTKAERDALSYAIYSGKMSHQPESREFRYWLQSNFFPRVDAFLAEVLAPEIESAAAMPGTLARGVGAMGKDLWDAMGRGMKRSSVMMPRPTASY